VARRTGLSASSELAVRAHDEQKVLSRSKDAAVRDDPRGHPFHQGEALIAGKISPQPALLRFGTRITEEGGADVPAT
jgi:hypothetical protein